MKIKDTYDEWAPEYDVQENKTRDLDAEVTRKVLAGQQFKHILELGCGTGKNTQFYAGIGERVTAVDYSEGMLARARKIGGLDNVTFVQADLGKPWPQLDKSHDLAVCNLVLEHLENLDPVFAQTAGILIPGGTFFISELHPFRQYLGAKATIKTGEGEREIPAFVHHVSDFLDAAERNGFRLERLGEWRHPEDIEKPPRLATFLFRHKESQQGAIAR